MAQNVIGTSVSAAQLKDLFRQINEGAVTGLMLQAFLDRRNPFANFAKPDEIFITSEYFQTNKNLCVWNSFPSRITAAYPKPIKKRGITGVEKAFDLKKYMFYKHIVKQLGGEGEVRKYAFTPDQIADMIDAQPNGHSGPMLTNGYANIFYVIGVNGILFAVVVYWNTGNLHWDVNTFELDELGLWNGGNRIFRNTLMLGA